MSSKNLMEKLQEKNDKFVVRLKHQGPKEFHGQIAGEKIRFQRGKLYAMNIGIIDQLNKYDQFEIVGIANGNTDTIDLTEMGKTNKSKSLILKSVAHVQSRISEARENEIEDQKMQDEEHRQKEIEYLQSRIEALRDGLSITHNGRGKVVVKGERKEKINKKKKKEEMPETVTNEDNGYEQQETQE